MLTHMLIATDGSELADKAVSEGLALAAKTGARVTALTVTESWSVLEMTDRVRAGSPNPIDEFATIADRRAAEILDPVAEKAKAMQVPCEVVHRPESAPAEAIVDEADKRNCDMIVMASHGRRGIDRLLVGSQTLRVLALTSRPVLVYR
jgi:nucleotide-binding universal stress UspA family protein